MTFSFKYRREKFGNKEFYFPKVPIILSRGDVQIEVAALLDSGSTAIFIPKEMAETLGLELRSSDLADSWTGKFKIWESRIGIILGKGSQTFRKVLPCNVPDEKSETEEVIFGRTFFQFFEVTFNEKNRKTILKKF